MAVWYTSKSRPCSAACTCLVPYRLISAVTGSFPVLTDLLYRPLLVNRIFEQG